MKRHSALVPLSRDHHQSLVLAQRLRRATDDTFSDTARMFLAHWEAEEQQHFCLEEEILLPAYTAHGTPQHPAILRTLVEHAVIRRDAAQLTVAPTLEVLHLIGVRLADHIAFEEQELFPLIEAALTEAELGVLGDRIEDRVPPQLQG
ncbi:MAG TPA: hemerythrin domain-containing protein [Solirubrobacteraceae bacterium]